MICLVIVRVRPPVYQHRCNGCSLGAGQRLRRLGRDLTPAFRYAASVRRRHWWAVAGMICLVKGRDAPPAYQRRCNGCSLGAGQRLRRLGHDLTPAFRYAASVWRRHWWAAAGMICLVKGLDAPPACLPAPG